MYKRILIAGTARGGTTYASRVLKHLVPATTHEALGISNLHFTDFPYPIEVTGAGIAFISQMVPSVKCILQTRNPLKVVRRHVWSWLPPEDDLSHTRYQATRQGQNLVYRHIYGEDIPHYSPILKEGEDLWAMACAYLAGVWKHALAVTDFQYQIEDFQNALPTILGFIGEVHSPEQIEYAVTHAISNSKTSLVNPDVWYENRVFGDLSPELREIAKELGYHD